MKRQKIGYRGLARRIVGPEASLQQLDNVRGQLRDWLGDPPKHRPSLRNRVRVVEALGMDAALADDEEEDDLPSFLARETERAARRWQREQMNRRATEGTRA